MTHGALIMSHLFVVPSGAAPLTTRGWVGRQLFAYNLRTTTLEPDFRFLPITRDMTRCWLGSVDSAHEPGVAVLSQRSANLRPAARSPQDSDTIPWIRTILDMPTIVRVEVGSLIAAQHDMGVCDAIHADAPRTGDEKR